jgi:hypothetical protein
MLTEELFAMIFVVGMFAGVFIIYLGLRQRSLQLEMQHRERMAMIERGQIPLADVDTAMHVRRVSVSGPAARSLSFGIVIVGLGLAMMTIIGIAGESPESGIGIGGAIAILGGAFIVRSIVVREPTQPLTGSRPSVTLPGDRLD